MPTFQTIAGAVNGIATTRGVRTDGPDLQTINIADDGSPTTLDVNTDGNPPNEAAVSSRVAIIGGTTSGRDHFPWAAFDASPLTAFDAGDGGAYPVPMTLAQAMALTLRVKTWKCSWTSVTDGSNSLGPGNFTSNVAASRESDLVLASRTAFADQFSDFGSVSGVIQVAIENQDGYNNAPVIYNAGSFYPQLQIYIQSGTDLDHLVTRLSSSPYWDADANLGLTVGANATLSLFGTDYTVKLFITAGGTWTATGLKIEPVAFWPYAARDGSPIYDTSTGAQLQNPLN